MSHTLTTQFHTRTLEFNTLQNVVERWNTENPVDTSWAIVSHADELGTWGFAYTPGPATAAELEARVRGLLLVQGHAQEVRELVDEGRLVEASWHLRKLCDTVVWRSEAFKRTEEWRLWQSILLASSVVLDEALREADAEEVAQVEKVRAAWLRWKLPVSPEKAKSL